MYQTWRLKDCIVREFNYGDEIHGLRVYAADDITVLGEIYPLTHKDFELSCYALNEGRSPIAEKWSDGRGNVCSNHKWGEQIELEREIEEENKAMKAKSAYLYDR